MINNIKKLRVFIDGTMGAIANLKMDGENFHSEASKPGHMMNARTSAELGKMWLGMSLKELEVENPYPDSMNASNEKIAPTADTSKLDLDEDFFKKGDTYIQRVKRLREIVQRHVDDSEYIRKEHLGPAGNMKMQLIFNNVYTNLVEAKLWLGMELGRIRDLQMNSEDGVA